MPGFIGDHLLQGSRKFRLHRATSFSTVQLGDRDRYPFLIPHSPTPLRGSLAKHHLVRHSNLSLNTWLLGSVALQLRNLLSDSFHLVLHPLSRSRCLFDHVSCASASGDWTAKKAKGSDVWDLPSTALSLDVAYADPDYDSCSP